MELSLDGRPLVVVVGMEAQPRANAPDDSGSERQGIGPSHVASEDPSIEGSHWIAGYTAFAMPQGPSSRFRSQFVDELHKAADLRGLIHANG